MAGLPPYEWLTRDTAEASKTVLAVANARGCPPELGSKPLLPKVPCTLTAAHKETQLELNWKLPPCLPDFIVLEGSIPATGGNSLAQLWTLNIALPILGKVYPLVHSWHVCWGNNQLFPSWTGGWLPRKEFVPGSWYKPGQKLMDREVTDQVWPTAVV